MVYRFNDWTGDFRHRANPTKIVLPKIRRKAP